MKKIANAAGEINASIMQSFLVMHGIEATFAPAEPNSNGLTSSTGPHHLFVSEDKAEEAIKLLKDQGLLVS